MYQSSYVPGRKKPVRGKFIGILFALGIVGAGVRYLPKIGEKVEEIQVQQTTTQTGVFDNRYVGKKVALSGDLTVSHEPLTYSHVLSFPDASGTKEVYIRSSTRDIHTYTGFVYIEGVVSKFDGTHFIIDVDAIGNSPDAMYTISMPTSTTSRVFPDMGIKIDMGSRTDVSYAHSGQTLVFHAEGFSGSMRSEAFRCEVGFAEKDCEAMQKTYTQGSFVSAGGLTFAKGDDGRFAYNDSGIGYRISTDSDALLYKASNVIIPINARYIASLLPAIQKVCNTTISPSQLQVEKESLSSWKGTAPSCTVRILFSETGEDISVISGAKPSPTTGTTAGQDSTIQAPNTAATAPVLSTQGITFTSTRGGYTISFPSAKIAYNGVNIQEDLGVKGLFCYVRIDIKAYQDKDNDAIGPSVVIYECTSKESSATLANKVSGYTFATNKDGTKLFFIQAKQESWNEFTKKITIE